MAGRITVSTIGDLIDQGYRIHVWCQACGRGRPADLQKLAAKYGRNHPYIASEGSRIVIRCKDCGAKPPPFNIEPRR